MKKFLSIFLALMLVFSIGTTAFAAEDEGEPAEAVEEVVDLAEAVGEAEEEPAEEPAEELGEEPGEEGEDVPVGVELEEEPSEDPKDDEVLATEEPADAEPEQEGVPGHIKAMIAGLILLAFGGVILYFGNKRLKPQPKKSK